LIDPKTDRMLITGAIDAVGSAMRADWRHLRPTDIRPVQSLTNNEEARSFRKLSRRSGPWIPSDFLSCDALT
jgi:hypothetical protein